MATKLKTAVQCEYGKGTPGQCTRKTKDKDLRCWQHKGKNRAPTAADVNTTAAVAAVAEAAGISGILTDEDMDNDTFALAGTLARKGKDETDAQKRLNGQLKEFFKSREEWKGTLLDHATLMRSSRLTGSGNLRLAAMHYRWLKHKNRKPTGIMMPRSKWEELERPIKEGDRGFEIWVPRKVETKTEENPETGEEERTEGYTYFRYGGDNRRYFDACETEGGDIMTENQFKMDAWHEAAQNIKTDLTPEEIAEINETFLSKAEEMGLEVKYEDQSHLGGAHGYFQRSENLIVLDVHQSTLEQAKTLVHELAHAADPSLKDDHDNSIYKRNRDLAEFVAESCAFAVLDQMGVDSSMESAIYLDHWKPKTIKQAKNIYNRCMKIMNVLIERPEEDVVVAAPEEDND